MKKKRGKIRKIVDFEQSKTIPMKTKLIKPDSFFSKILIFFFSIGMLVGIECYFRYLTHGFGITSISSKLSYQTNWDVTISKTDLTEVEKALIQSYVYLGSGSQSYVFLSKDQNYVIKFFKHKRWRLNPLLKTLSSSLPSFFKKKQQEWEARKKRTLHKTFNSCKISYELFKNDTGLIYIHLNKTHHLKTILTLSDPIGLKYKLNLDDFEFILQKKALPTDEYLLKLKKNNQTEKAKKALKEIFKFTEYRAQLGYSDKDPHPIRNFGFIDGRAIEIDIGGFHHDPKKDLHYYRHFELIKIQKKLLPWLNKNYPELSSFALNQIAKLKRKE